MTKNKKMKTHELKTWPVFFEAIINGTKTFEVRQNDRNFQVGDILELREYDPDAEGYTGRKCTKEVTYILGDNPFFQLNNTVIMGISSLKSMRDEKEDGMIRYIKSEYDQQIRRMVKIFGKEPDVFEQGVNLLLAMIESPELFASQSSPQSQPGRRAEEILSDKWGKPQMNSTNIADQFLKKMALEAMEEYRTQSEGKDMCPKEEKCECEEKTNVYFGKDMKKYCGKCNKLY